MLKLSHFFAMLLVGTQATLQGWHRKGCPLAKDLKVPLSVMVARNFDLSKYYFQNEKKPVLGMLVREFVFRNETNEQAIAIMRFESTIYKGRGYFYVLLENCCVGYEKDNKKNKMFYFELNISNPSFEIYGTVKEAKAAAKAFEGNNGKWPVTSNLPVVDVKTDTLKNIEITVKVVGGTIFFPFVLIARLLEILGFADTSPNYTYLEKHWVGKEWKPDREHKILAEKGKDFTISGKVYKNASV